MRFVPHLLHGAASIMSWTAQDNLLLLCSRFVTHTNTFEDLDVNVFSQTVETSHLSMRAPASVLQR